MLCVARHPTSGINGHACNVAGLSTFCMRPLTLRCQRNSPKGQRKGD